MLDEQHLFGSVLGELERAIIQRELSVKIFLALRRTNLFANYPLLREIEAALIEIVVLV